MYKFCAAAKIIAFIALFAMSLLAANADKQTETRTSKTAKSAGKTKKTAQSSQAQLAKEIARGKALYKAQDCGACHKIAGEGCLEGVSLDGIGKRRSAQFLMDHLKDPEEHVSKNKKAFGGDPVNLMPHPNLEQSEIRLIAKYLQSLR